jgi:hypothetical protein
MTDEQRKLLEGMLYQMSRIYDLSDKHADDIATTQAYATGLIALQLDRIATALEKRVSNPDESTN